MTTHQITIIALSFLVAWSLSTCIRLLSKESKLERQKQKAIYIQTVRTAHTAFSLGLLASIFFLPGLWHVFVAITLYNVAVSWKLTCKQTRLIDEIDALYQSESILSLKVGTDDHTPNGSPLKIWFKRGSESWPVAELEIGVGISSLPIDKTPDHILRDYFLPRILNAFQSEKADEVFSHIKMDLAAQGVLHPIDIKGWDYHPVFREMIERIMDSTPAQTIHPEEADIKAA